MKNTIAIEFLKKNRLNVNFIDGNADSQNSGIEIFENLADAEKSFEQMSLDMNGSWSRHWGEQPEIYKEICKVTIVGKNALENLADALEIGENKEIQAALIEIHFTFSTPIKREQWFWENKWDDEDKFCGEYVKVENCNRGFDTLAFDENSINIDSLEDEISKGQIDNRKRN